MLPSLLITASGGILCPLIRAGNVAERRRAPGAGPPRRTVNETSETTTRASPGSLLPSEKRVLADDRTGAEIWQLTAAPCINHAPYFLNPAWAGARRDLLVITSYRAGGPDLFGVRLLDGAEIALAVRRGAVNALVAFRADTGAARTLHETPALIAHAQWSPDGRAVLFASDLPRMWLVEADGTDARPLRPQTRPGVLTLTYRAAIIGLGHTGSTFDDEKGRFSRWQAPHAHAACYRAVAGVELLAGADPHPSQREAFGQKWAPARSTSTPTTARCSNASSRTSSACARPPGRAPRSWARSRALPG